MHKLVRVRGRFKFKVRLRNATISSTNPIKDGKAVSSSQTRQEGTTSDKAR